MIGTIRKHSKWLWGIIIAVTITTFVIFFSPNSRNPGYRGQENIGSIDGVRISLEEYTDAYREAQLFYFFRSGGQWPDQNAAETGYDVNREAYQRLFFIRKLQQYNVDVDAAAVAQAASEIVRQTTRGKSFDDFYRQVLASHVSEEDFERYLRHELALQQLLGVLGLSGDMLTPQELETLYTLKYQELATEAVFFSESNYIASVTAPNPAVLADFYTNQMSAYTVPERVQVQYVGFEITNFLAGADQQMAKLTNLNAIVERAYQDRGTNYYRDAKSPEEAKQKIREELRHKVAVSLAQKKAEEFLSELIDREAKPQMFAEFARTNGLTAKTTQPFDLEGGPSELEGGPNFAREAFNRTPEEPFAGPLEGDTAVYVIALDKKLPREFLPFNTIQERVANDYKSYQAVQLARRAASDFSQSLTNGLAQGKTFAAVCADAKVKAVSIPPFSISSTNELPEVEKHASDSLFKQVAFSTPVGKASDPVSTRDGAMIVYTDKRVPIDHATMQARMPEFASEMRAMRRREVLESWFQKQESKSMDVPQLQQQRQPPMRPGPARS